MTDLWLALAHHVLVFGLVIMIALQAGMIRETMRPADVTKLARLDAGYGVTAGLLILAGVLRVLYGAKGYEYYIQNVWFWAKMASFAVIGLLSIRPTLFFRAWRTSAVAMPDFVPPADDVRAARFYVQLELRLILLVAIFAAIMARYTSL